MEWNNDYDGQKWEFPKCLKCKYADGGFCKKYKGDRIDLPIDLFECPGFEEDVKDGE